MQRILRTIGEFVDREAVPALVHRDQTVAATVQTMQRCDSGCALVVERDRVVAIFTERDFLQRVAAAGRDPANTPVWAVCTPDPTCLHPEDSICYAINLMAVGGFRNVPIVDRERRPIAVLTAAMVRSHLHELVAELESEPLPAAEAAQWVDIGGG
jgi:CBS domain-containing protein